MEKTTAELTGEYIREHPDIKNCLKKGLINYSSLSRHIAKELDIEKKTSKEAILIAARRFRQGLKKELDNERKIKHILSRSELEIRNKIIVFILEKRLDIDSLNDLEKIIRSDSGLCFVLEGSGNYTIITQEKYEPLIDKRFRSRTIKKSRSLTLITMTSPKDIETTRGVVSFLTSLFGENGVNIIEFLSCWTDTLFVIDSSDLQKTIAFLSFSS